MEEKGKFVITKELIEKAKTYMPLSEKTEMANYLVTECLVEAEKGEQELSMGLSPLWKEDNAQKAVAYQTLFLQFYLGIDFTENKNTFDDYASSFIFNALERLKNDKDVKDKIYDMIYDFREFKKLADAEIYQEKQRRNDPINRLLENMAKVSSPENFKEKTEELEKVMSEIEKGRAALNEKRSAEASKK